MAWAGKTQAQRDYEDWVYERAKMRREEIEEEKELKKKKHIGGM